MNILEASYRVGLALKKSKEGIELFTLYKEARESVTSQVWTDFEKVGKRKWGKHYFTYPNGLAIFRDNSENDDLPVPLKEDIEKVLSSNKIKEFSSKCEKMGIALEEVAKNSFSLTIPKTFSDISTPPKLVRAIQDLGICCQRSGIFKVFIQQYKSKEFMSKLEEYSDKREGMDSIPFCHEARNLVRSLAKETISAESIYAMEAFFSILSVIKQVIFETHFDLILSLANEDINKFRKYEKGKLSLFSIKLNEYMINIMNWNGSIISYNQGNKTNYALVERKRVSWKGQDSPAKITIRGVVYPDDDSIIK